ncbi:myb-like protein D isoform X2 [Adelges cooleyi]|uniref:myb-like protein D isoform X2 n=1 Tax=Adelges cooleyi TaxID=133065 RepID=UPI00217FE235|nr:myb-like protein D isoform X2 [Adelges cooleyi]
MERSGMSSKQNDSDHDMKSLTHWHELMVERISQRKKVFCDTLKTKMINDINAYMHNLRSNTTFDTIQQDLVNIVTGYDYDVASQTFIDGIICAAFELFCQLIVFNSTEFIAKARTAFTFPSLTRPTPSPTHEKEVKMPCTSSTTDNFMPTAGRKQNLNQIISQSVLSNMSALNGGINLGDVSASINKDIACSSRNNVSEKSNSNNGIENSTVLTASQNVSPNAASQANSGSISRGQTSNSLNSPQSHSQDSVPIIDENINTEFPNDISPKVDDKVQIKFRENVSSNFLDFSQVKGENDSTDSLFDTDVMISTDNSNMNTGNTILMEVTRVTEDLTTVNNTNTNNKSMHKNVVKVRISKPEKCDKHNSSKKGNKKEKKKEKTRKKKGRSKSKSKKDKSNWDKNKSLEFDNKLNKVLSSVSNSSAVVQSDLSNSVSVTDDLFTEFIKKSGATENINDNVACSENPITSEITDFKITHSDLTTKVQSTKDTFKQAELSKQIDENEENKDDVKKKDKVIAINTKKQYERAKKDLFLPDFVFSPIPKKCTNQGNENANIVNENTNIGNDNTNIGNKNISEIVNKPVTNKKSKTKKRRRSFSLLNIKRKKIQHECKVDETKMADTPETCQPEPLTNNNPEHHTSCNNSDEQNIMYDCENSNATLTSQNGIDTSFNNNISLNNDSMPEWMKKLCDVHNIKKSYVLLTKLKITK